MIRFIVVIALFAVVGGVIWWDRAEKAKKRQVFFSLYNKAMSNSNSKDKKVWGVTINILDVIDETDIGPNLIHTILKEMERLDFITMKSNTVKLTQAGVTYFRYKYLSEEVNESEIV